MTKGEMALSKTFSARFWVVILMTVCGCYMAIHNKTIDSQFGTLWGVVVTYYFGKSEQSSPFTKPEVKTEVSNG